MNKKAFESQYACGRSPFFPATTGLPYTFLAVTKPASSRSTTPCVPYCLLSDTGGIALVLIAGTPQIRHRIGNIALHADIEAFINLNRDALLEHWRGAIDTVELAERIRKI